MTKNKIINTLLSLAITSSQITHAALDNANEYINNYSIYAGGGSGLHASGDQNTAYGYASLGGSSTGSYNTALGANTLTTLSSGVFNVAVGSGALLNLISGNENSSLGQGSLVHLTSGSNNSAYGWSSFYRLESGSNNIAMGWEAADSMNEGSGNIFIGYDVQGSSYSGDPYDFYTANDELNIGNIIYGRMSSTSSQQKIGINTSNPISTLDVNGRITVRGGNPKAGYVLTAMSNSGKAAWRPVNSTNISEVISLSPTEEAPSSPSMGDLYAHSSGALCYYSGSWEQINSIGSCP